VDGIADLELGGAEELLVGLGGEQACQGPEIGVGGLFEGVVDALTSPR
jgi:hypothetical protein